MKKPVSPVRITIAEGFGLVNVDVIAETCRVAEVPFYAACALFEKESGGRNVYGHDAGGALSGFERPVNRENYEVFEWLVFTKGHLSNGVGPAQITWKGFFPDMASRGLQPWDVHDNMLYGLELLAEYRAIRGSSWATAGERYNGGRAYGLDFATKVETWRRRLRG